jgi:uncharacterized protein involved in exopolysaccharide biosynthesis
MQSPTTETSVSALDAALTSLGRSLTVLLRVRRRVLACVLSGGALGAVIALLIPNQYTSTATFIVQGSPALNLPAVLQGAALSLGFDRGSDYSPKFYADLLTSRPILESAVMHPYQLRVGDSDRVQNYERIEGFDRLLAPRALDAAIRHLANRVSASADVRTNMITLSVRARDPDLSRDIASQMMKTLDSLNVGFRQNQSRASREFYETRVLQTRRELDSAESAVISFLQNNRTVASPALQFELARLQREATLKQAVYSIVVQQYEQARLQEARNVPTISILSQPFVPVRKSFPPRRLIVVVCAGIGLFLVWIQISVAEALSRFRADDPSNWRALEEQIPGIRRVRGAGT